MLVVAAIGAVLAQDRVERSHVKASLLSAGLDLRDFALDRLAVVHEIRAQRIERVVAPRNFFEIALQPTKRAAVTVRHGRIPPRLDVIRRAHVAARACGSALMQHEKRKLSCPPDKEPTPLNAKSKCCVRPYRRVVFGMGA